MAARLYSIVVDCTDVAAQGRWWSAALGWPISYEAADEVVVERDGGEAAGVPALVFVPVPEPKTAKNRIHLDLASQSPEDQEAVVARLLAAGAVPVAVGQGPDVPWVVLADPEGNELCVLEPRGHDLGRGPLASIVVDVADPEVMVAFWAAATSWDVQAPRLEGIRTLHNPSGALPDLDFVTVPEPRTVKGRVHLDVAPRPGDDQGAEVARLEERGATRVDVGQGPDVTWVVLADPEGNEWCVLRPR